MYQTRADTRDELVRRIMDGAEQIRRNRFKLIRAMRDVQKRATKCVEVNGDLFEHLL